MAYVRFTKNLSRLFPGLDSTQVDAATVGETIRFLERDHPRLTTYLTDEQGALRRHVNVFVRGALVRDRQELSDAVAEDDEVYIVQSLSGG